MRFLFIDKILTYKPYKEATASKLVTMSEDFLMDHFPRFPVMPGVLQVEAILQLGSWLVALSSDFKKKTITSEIGSIKFKDFVKPGDVMLVEVKIISVDDEKVKIKGHVKVDGKTKTVLSSAYLKYIDLEQLEDPQEAKEYFFYITGEKPWGIYSEKKGKMVF